MADRDQFISEPAPQPSHATPSPSPQAQPPAGWDESAGFRETFLRHVTDAEDDRTLRHLARMLHESTLELAHFAPPSGESATREELRAAAADLRHLQGFLAAVAHSRVESELSPADEELAALADEQSQAVAELAVVLEQALG
jgi:hypothetical protein